MVFVTPEGKGAIETFKQKGSGYGPLDTGPAQKAVRTEFPVDAAYRPPVPATPAYGAAQGVMDAAARYNPSTWFEPEPVSGTYGLDFGYQSPITYEPSFQDVQTPWLAPDPWQTRPDNTGGFLGSLGRGAVDLGQQVWDIQQQRTNVSGGLGYAPYSSGGAGQVDPRQQSLEALEYQVSGNKWLEAAGFNPDALPYNLGYITDAINPIGIAAVGAGPSVPIIGSTLGGGLAKRAAGEIAIDVASRVGAEQAAGDLGASIPLFGELEPWQRGLIGGLAGGVTAAGGLKAIDDVDFGAAGRSLAESNPFAAPQPGAFDIPRGAIDPSTGRPFEWQSPMGGADRVTRSDMDDYTRAYLEQYGRGTPGVSPGLTRPDGSGELVYRDADGVPRGVVAFTPSEITDIAVDPTVRRTGIAQQLVEEARVRGKTTMRGPFTPEGEGLARSVGMYPQTSSALSADSAPVMDARRSLLDALDEETKLRTSGVVEAEISAGRGTQAAGIRTGLQGLSSEATLDDALSAARQGASTGPLRKTIAAPLDITPEVQTQLVRDILDNPNLREFDTLRALKALDKLTQGDGLQPNEIKMLGRIFGPEVAAKISEVNAGRIPTVAQLTEADFREIDRIAQIDGKKVARFEVEARAQHKLADDLQAKARMNPTNKNLAKAADNARARALDLDNKAHRALLDRIETAERKIARKQQATARAENAREVRAAEVRDRRAMRAENRARLNTAEQTVTQAKDIIARQDLPNAVKSKLIDAIEISVETNTRVLDGLGDGGPSILRHVYSAVTGEVTDSWVAKQLSQQAFVETALKNEGLNPDIAHEIGKLLTEAQIKAKYGNNIPASVQKSLDQAKWFPKRGQPVDQSIEGAASITGLLKNTTMSVGDLAVVLQNGLKAFGTANASVLAYTVNRVLNLMHLGMMTMPDDVAKQMQYALDGLQLTSKGIVDFDATADRSLLSLFGKPGQWVDDKAFVPVAKKMADLQFRVFLGNVRKVIYEGNLVLARAVGEDITDPLVRARAADWANAATGAGKLAQRGRRAALERATLLSAPLTRAQMQQVGQVARGLTVGSKLDRMLAASTIASVGLTTLVVGKALNDWMGVDEFEFDPTKPGFGYVTLKDGTVINLFPQEQFATSLLKSLRLLAEGDITDTDWDRLWKTWANFGMGRSSPTASTALAAGGMGFDPKEGSWKYGDLQLGPTGLLERLTLPPIAQNALNEGIDPVRTPLEALGGNAYQESDYSARDRFIGEQPGTEGLTWNQLTPTQQDEVTAQFGRVYSSDPDIKKKQQRGDKSRENQFTEQAKIDGYLAAGEKNGQPYTVDDWKVDTGKNRAFYAGVREGIWGDTEFKDKEQLNPLDRYYAVRDQLTTPDGEVNWDLLEMWLKLQPAKAQAYIEEGLTRYMTDTERQYRTDTKQIADTGYFDLEEGKMDARLANPELDALVRKWGYSQASTQYQDALATFQQQQAVDDADLQAGNIDRQKWLDNYHERRTALNAQRDAIFAGFVEDEPDATDPLERFFAEIDKNVKPNGIDVDWGAVDAWVASQPAKDQEIINSYEGKALTPAVAEYKADVEMVAESGWFDRTEENWQKVKDAYASEGDTSLAGYATYQDWQKAAKAEILSAPEAQAWIAQNNPPPEYIDRIVADALADLGPGKGMEWFNGDFRDQWVLNNPQAAYTAWKWGWFTPTNAIAGWLSEQYAAGVVK